MVAFSPLVPFGVQADGVDLSRPLADADFAELERAFYANHVLALRARTSRPGNSWISRAASGHRSRT